MAGFRIRYIGPVILIALCLVCLCTFTAVSLFLQQASVTRALRENVQSQRAALELVNCLQDLIALEDAQVETVAVLHKRVGRLVRAIREAADQPDEQTLSGRIESGYAAYLGQWGELPPSNAAVHELARRRTTRYLEAEVLKPCQEFEVYNTRRIEVSTAHHERVLRQLAWGMGVVGLLGGVSGVVLGFGVARGLNRSIRRLQVQLRDAAGKLSPNLSEIIVTEAGDFHGLHSEAARLTGRIEQTVRDLQEREHEVLRAEQLAAVGQLAAGVAHEIRNPLTSIKMLVQIGLEDGAGIAGEDLRVIEGEVRRMERSLQIFLDFARPPKGERRALQLGPLLGEVLSLVGGRAERQRVALTADLPADEVTLTGDREQLRQVLVNLSLNALDAMPGGGELAVRVRRRERCVEVEFADTGPGIPPAVFRRLFQPFTSTKDTGLGLGLVISKRIVEDHGGTVNATNRPGGGASLFLRIPLPALPPASPLPHPVERGHADRPAG